MNPSNAASSPTMEEEKKKKGGGGGEREGTKTDHIWQSRGAKEGKKKEKILP